MLSGRTCCLILPGSQRMFKHGVKTGSGKADGKIFLAQGGGKTVVLYRGICLVSKGDRLKITGKWRGGKQFGIQGNVVVADRVENVSSGIVFEKA